ncbi:unnamed protein product [Closterium sp. NIES-64]|nr:unnamed protein product [Closterium sp. NIES-64]
MYAVSDSVEGECYLCVPPHSGIVAAALGAGEAAALGASVSAASGAGESALSGTTSAQAVHTFILDSGASRSFFEDRTTLTPLSRPVVVSLADPSGGTVFASFSTVLPCPGAPSGTLLGLYLPRSLQTWASARPSRFRPLNSKMGLLSARIGMVMDVARTSMIHAATPHFPWPFAVLYAAHQLNLHPQVSLPETSPTLGWTRKVGDASAFRVWGSRAFVRDLSADKLSPRAAPCVFLGFPPHAPWWQFYHPTSRRPPRVDPLPPQGFALSGVSQVDEVEPVKVAVDSGAARGAEPAGARLEVLGLRGAERAGAEPGGAKSGGAEPGGAESGGAKRGCAEPGGAGSARLAARYASSRREPLSPRELRKWLARRLSRAARAGDTTVAAGPGGTAGAAGGIGAAGPARARAAGGVGAGGSAGAGASKGARVGAVGGGGTAGAGAAAGGIGAVLAGSGGTVRPRPYLPQSQLQLASPLLAPSPYTGPTGGLAEHREPASRPALPVRAARTSRRALRLLPPAVPGTHHMALRPSTAPLRVPLPSPPNSSLPLLAHPESDSLPAASPIVTRLLTTVVSDPSFESTAASALVAELVKFAARCRQDYAASLVAESEFVCPPSVGGECALSTDVLEERDPDELDIPTPRSYAEAIEGPYSSQWQSAMDAEMASWKSTGTYVDEVPPPGANIVSGLWIFRVNWPTGSPRVFKARYVARGFSQHQGVDYFQTFSPTPKMTTLQVLLHIAAQRDYELHSLDLSTAFLQGSLHEEIWLCRPTWLHWVVSSWYPVEPPPAKHMAAAKRVLRYLCSTSGMGLVLGGRRRVVLTGHADASWGDDQATQRSSHGYTFSLGSGSVLWRSTRSSSVLGSSCESEIYVGAMAAQELRWLTYLLTDLGEQARSPPVLYVDNKAMLALCREHRVEHRTKHIALRYFLARELQQRGQLLLAYVASEANTADIFTKALPPGDHQRFCTMLGLVPTWPHLLTS